MDITDQEAIIEEQEPNTIWQRALHLTTGICVAGLLLYLAIRNVDVPKALAVLSGIDLRRLTPIILLSIVIAWMRVWRWQMMFPSASRPSGRAVFHAFVLGAFGNCVLPGRLGDLARAGIIARDVPTTGVSGALATVVLEKVMDGLAVLMLLAVAFWFAPLPAWLVRTGLVAAAAFAVGLTVLFLLARYGIHGATFGPMVPVGSGRSRFITTLQGLFHRFSGGLAVATSMRQLAVLLLFSLLIWSSESLVVFLSFRLFDIALPPTAAVVTIVFLTVGTMLPAAPGFIGTYQFFVISALALYGVSANAGLALSIFMNLFAIGIAAAFAAIAMLVRQLPAKKYSLDQG